MSKLILFVFCILFTKNILAQTDSSAAHNWSVHYQFTAVSQSHPAFKAKYSGVNSLSNSRERGFLTITSTAYIGRKLWKGAAGYFNAEISGGQGFSGARGIAGFTNGESFRVGDPDPKLYMARAYVQQHFALGKSKTYNNDDANQVADSVPASRITLTAGKFAVSDFFDDNSYSHDPRSQFLNWALMGNGAWDYPANTRGYTVGFVAELIQPNRAFRVSAVQEPKLANGPILDSRILKRYGLTAELEKSYNIGKQQGTVRLLGFRNQSSSVKYNTAAALAKQGDSTGFNVASGAAIYPQYKGLKYGFGVNAEQQLSSAIGCFVRASWNDGKTATWAYTEIDKSVSGGVNVLGKIWHRDDDNVGVAFVANGISKEHQSYLQQGLYGFIIGDGNLNYASENIAEVYYNAQLFKHVYAAADYQFVSNPGYNKDRGPVSVFSLRGHIEF